MDSFTANNGNCSSIMCSGGGWQVADGYEFGRCFFQGVTVQVPTFIILTIGTFFLISLRRRKEITHTPAASARAQRIRFAVQSFVTVALGFLLLLQAWTVHKSATGDIAFWSPIAQTLSLVLAALLSYVELKKTTKPTGVLLIYWSTLVIVQLLELSSLTQSFSIRAPQKLQVLSTILTVIVLVLEWRQPHRERDNSRFKNPYDSADLFSRLWFTWMNPVMRQGFEHYLDEDDLPDLASYDRTDSCNGRFEKNWQHQLKSNPKNPSLLISLFQTFGVKYFYGGFLKLLQDSSAFVQPQLLRLLLVFVTEYNVSKGNIPLTRGIYISIAMFTVSFIQTIVLHQYFERSFGTGMNVRTAVTNAIFRKSLILSGEARDTRTTGDTVNLMSIDTQRLQDVTSNGHMVWSGPFQIIICLWSLHNLVGKSMWVGVIVLIVMIPFNSRLARKQSGLQKQQMADKDLRTRLTSELISSIKSIKLYAWEEPFKSRLHDVRENRELKSLKKIGLFNATMSYLWNFTPFLVSCSTFAVYVFINKKPLTTDIIFPALSLFNMLSFPMTMFPMLISNLIEASVALKRIASYLVGEELQPDAITRVPKALNVGDDAVVLKNAVFVYKEENIAKGLYAIHDVNLVAKKGELTCIVGRVGSGKTSLLVSILGDTKKVSGNVTVAGSIAYVSQTPWIFNGSVRENILFGMNYNEELYSDTIDACALKDDLDILPDGDHSIVGEKGLSLSGGQKARISLARAVYAQADVYLLDDPLSAVDEHVGQHIISNVLSKTGLLAAKTVLLATNSIPVLQHADHLAMVVDGEICEQGALKDKTPRITALLTEFGGKTAQKPETSDDSSSELTISKDADSDEQPEAFVKNANAARRNSARRPSVASFSNQGNLNLRKEHSEKGKVSWNVYKEYLRVCGIPSVSIFIGMLLFSNGLSVAGNVWLKHWADSNTSSDGNNHVIWFLSVYAVLGILSALFTAIQSVHANVFIGINAARKLHERMINCVIRAPMSFFETNPLGRIVNRFSNDVYRVDQTLIRVCLMLLSNCTRVAYVVAIICYSTPWFMVIAVFLAYFYVSYQQYYLRTSRELKRLDSTSKSPIFNQFQETLDGIATVRAFGAVERSNHTNRWHIDTNNKAYFLTLGANRWLAVRLEFVGSVMIFAASGLAVLALPRRHISAGLVGLALSYALQVTQALNWIVRMTVEVETNIVSVERMMEYSSLPSEAPVEIPETAPSGNWPENGHLEMKNYSTRYRPELPLVLKNINLDIKPGEKIGIVGRTGAGKSSLTLALFRLIEGTEGHIEIDNVRTDEIGLKNLRTKLSIIPQDSQLFQGTVRNNLDPANKYSDEKLWNSLELSHLKNHVSLMEGGLDAKINEAGSNLSSGQRQLLSLARALLTDSKILVLDEATAAVDVETDQIVQKVIRKEFQGRTILTIAHRLNTIMDSDRVVVLSFGEVKEFDSPKNLLQREDSLFYALCKRGGLV